VISGKDVPDMYNYPILFFLIFLFFAYLLLSDDKVSIDFKRSTITIKNYNPLHNVFRKVILKHPSEIKFNEIDKVETDQTYFRKNGNIYYVSIQIYGLYKIEIAEFTGREQSEIFADFLKAVVRHKKIN
jgi:hypothetical protein